MPSPSLPDDHAAVLARIVAAMNKDQRFDAVLGGGSLLHGNFDQQSDLDLILIVRPDAYPDIMADRLSIANQIGDLLSAFSGEHVGEPRLIICLYGPPLVHVDLKFLRLEDLDKLVERPKILWSRTPDEVTAHIENAKIDWPERSSQWFEDRAWIWLHYAAAKYLRGEFFETIGMLAFFREQVLGPMWQRNQGQPQRGVRRLDQDSAARSVLETTVPRYDAGEIREALISSMQRYLELRAADPPSSKTAQMPKLLSDFIERGLS